MLVVDRRADEGNYKHGDNRAQVKALKDGRYDSPSVLIEPKEQLQKGMDAQGVIVITDSPGPQELLRFIFQRIWGVEEEN